MTHQKTYFTYLIASEDNRKVYVGITSNLPKRVHQHKTKFYKGYTSQHNIHKLVYFEFFRWPMEAINREKQIKSYRREKKDNLINAKNPDWNEIPPFLSCPE